MLKIRMSDYRLPSLTADHVCVQTLITVPVTTILILPCKHFTAVIHTHYYNTSC